MESLPGLGTRVNVHVRRILPTGLQVQIGEHGLGIIRPREISWNPLRQQEWRTQFRRGERLEAVVIRAEGQRLELSLRFVERDPWAQLDLAPGELHAGVVVSVEQHTAYVELYPGIEGRLPQDNLPEGIGQPISELLWPNDRLYTLVETVDAGKRQVRLTLQGVRELRRQQLAADDAGHSGVSPALPGVPPPEAHSDWPALQVDTMRTRRILLVEDDKDLRQLMRRWLQNAGHIVAVADDAVGALAESASFVPELVITDLRLPNMDGVQLVKQMRCERPGAVYIVMTDWITANERQTELDDLEKSGVELLLKPVLGEELVQLSFRAGQLAPAHDEGTGLRSETAVISPPVTPTRRRVTSNRYLPVLRDLLQVSRATQVVLFGFNLEQRQVHIAGQVGRAPVNQQGLKELIHSPVRDVAEDRRIVQIDDVDRAANYVRYLRPLLPFRSCVGVPVAGEQRARLALFLFSQEPGFVGRVVEQEARLAATAVAALQECRYAEESMAEMQQVTLLGHLTRGLVHETNNHVGRILLALSELEPECERLQRLAAQGDAALETELYHTGLQLKQLSERVQSLARTTRMFGRFTVQDQEEMVRVDRVVERCIDMVSDLAAASHIRIYYERPHHLFATRTKQTQLQQVVLNLLLNAVQQTAMVYPKQGGTIRVRIDLRPNAKAHYIRIHVEDNGPGIHQRWWSHIFQLGVTTRKGSGSGMGLFVSRQLAESANGHVFVMDSAPLWGTHMIAEFPIQLDV